MMPWKAFIGVESLRFVEQNKSEGFEPMKLKANSKIEYFVPRAVLNSPVGGYEPMPFKDDIFQVPEEWLMANASRFYFTDKQIIASAQKQFSAPSLPKFTRCYGIYFLILEGEIVYVGLSTNLSARLAAHKVRAIPFDSVVWFEAPEIFLESIEAYYIDRISPRLNLDRPIDGTFGKLVDLIGEKHYPVECRNKYAPWYDVAIKIEGHPTGSAKYHSNRWAVIAAGVAAAKS